MECVFHLHFVELMNIGVVPDAIVSMVIIKLMVNAFQFNQH